MNSVTTMIQGFWNTREVYVDGNLLSPQRSLKLVNHSPDGFCWGYRGSGPSQLALALLLECGATEQEALTWYHQFKDEAIATLPQEDFEMPTKLVTEWVEVRRLFASEFERGGGVGSSSAV